MWLFLLTGLIVGAGLLWLVSWLRTRGIAVKWYEWLIGAVGLALLLFAIQNFFTSLNEAEPSSASMYLLVMGLPALILLAVTWLLVARRQSAAG